MARTDGGRWFWLGLVALVVAAVAHSQWYRRALPHVDAQTAGDISAQIKRVEAGSVAPMRDPFEE